MIVETNIWDNIFGLLDRILKQILFYFFLFRYTWIVPFKVWIVS